MSVVNIAKHSESTSLSLDGKDVQNITAYLLAFGPDDDPARLAANKGLAYSGINPNGKGFVLKLGEMEELVRGDPKSAARIHPYLGSVEMNDSPEASFARFIIRFDDINEDSVRYYPLLYRHLYDTVRAHRQSSKEKRLRDYWWIFSRPAEDLQEALRSFDRVLVSGRVATHNTFAFQPTNIVFSDAVTVFLFDDNAAFALLQSQVHELWARFQGSSFKDDPRYIPEDCFETLPFPEAWQRDDRLKAGGRIYYEFRADLMIRNNEGLTKTYNRFHDPNENSSDIIKLRELHAAMDRVVLDAYGWKDVPTDCEFILDYEIDEEEWGDKKKPYRYRWPDEVRDEVLGRLLELNAQRAKEEQLAGAAAKNGKNAKKARAAARGANKELFS